MDSRRQRLMVADCMNYAVVVLSTAGGGLQWVKRIGVGICPWNPLVHPDTGAVVVCDAGTGKTGKVVSVDVESGEKTQLVVPGETGQLASMCWVEGQKQLWVGQREPACILRLEVDGSD